MCFTHLIKNSGVLPVGNEITPAGFLRTHSINRKAVNLPSTGKLSTSTIRIFSVGAYRDSLPLLFNSTISTVEVPSYVFIYPSQLYSSSVYYSSSDRKST